MKLKITKVKSSIDRSENQKRILLSLGLKKVNSSNVLEATPQILGMIAKVSHLVVTENV